jgi:DNA helicase-2/ATP-dependent DNA helicase PcrA
MEFLPRQAQAKVLEYTHGTMGISAVPGSGKTHTLSALAANLILDGMLEADQEILIVTLTNSAVDNFSTRINGFLENQSRRSLISPYRVRTLHGLAHDIVRERPDLVGLDSNFQIIDEREANQIRKDAASAWLQSRPQVIESYLISSLNQNRIDWLFREQLPGLIQSITVAFIRTAKDKQITPDTLRAMMEYRSLPLQLVDMGVEIYDDYQRALAYRGAIDFDDLIRLAVLALQSDPEFLNRLRYRWPYILEDEAQDSSRLQENILRRLSGPDGNWVRVGDPNQAIFESFTTANPEFLQNFIKVCEHPLSLPNSGRSSRSIINMANHLIVWTRENHPNPEARFALDFPLIVQTPPGDPQPNPQDRPDQIHLIHDEFSPGEELNFVLRSLLSWLPENPEKTVAVLVPRSHRGEMIARLFQENKIPFVELLKSTDSTRRTAGAIGNILRYLGDPKSPRKLATIYQVWRRNDREDTDLWVEVEKITQILQQIANVEDYLWPRLGHDWLDSLKTDGDEEPIRESLLKFRKKVQIWQGAVLLPIDQIVLTLAQDLFTDPAELAISQKFAALLRQTENSHQEWRLPELAGELAVIARNERRFLGFSEDDSGFNPDSHKGEVVISTMHKAKGLEWDRVYLLSVNNYNFPSGEASDHYFSEKWYIRKKLNLEAETLAQLETVSSGNEHEWYNEGAATQDARLEYIRERLRLFYVGITRARQELIITWNTGRNTDKKLTQSTAFKEIQSYWEEQYQS